MILDDTEDDLSLTRPCQTFHCLMQLEDTKDSHSPVFREVQFTESEVRETNDHHLNFLVASDGDNASLATPTARIYKELSMKCHAYGVQEGHGTSVHRVLNNAQPPVVDRLAEFAIVPTLPGRDLETAFHFHPYHLTTLVRMNPIWINEAYGSIIPQLYRGTSDECEANLVIGPTSSIAFPETYYFVYSEEQNFFLFIIMLFDVIRFNLESSMLIQCLECDVIFPHFRSHLVVPLDIQMTQREGCMKGKLSVAQMQIKEHAVVKEEVSKDLMQLEKSELSGEVEGLQKLVCELEDNSTMLIALLSATSQGREFMKKKLLLAEKQVEDYAALNKEASENLKHLKGVVPIAVTSPESQSPQEKVFLTCRRRNKVKGRISRFLSSLLARRWCAFEWFYSALDAQWFEKNEFVEYLNYVTLDILPRRLTPSEWSIIRCALGRSRRLSDHFLKGVRKKLYRHRERVRRLLAGKKVLSALSYPFLVGKKVLDYFASAREFHDGILFSIDHNICRVQFDLPENRVENIMDINCMLLGPHDNFPSPIKIRDSRTGPVSKLGIDCDDRNAQVLMAYNFLSVLQKSDESSDMLSHMIELLYSLLQEANFMVSKEAITSNGFKKGELFLADVNTQLKKNNITTSLKVDANSIIFATVTVDEPAPGLKTIFSFTVPDQKSGKVELQYLHDYAGINTSIGLTANPIINLPVLLVTTRLLLVVTFNLIQPRVNSWRAKLYQCRSYGILEHEQQVGKSYSFLPPHRQPAY